MASNESSMPKSSLRPLPVGGRKPKNLAEFISRVQSDRGFRNVTEESLREEIRQKKEAADKDEDTSMTGTDTKDDDDSDEEDAPKDINAVKADIMRNIDAAHNASMLALDCVSLILSKHSPNQAGATLSQALRELAGIGTLGVSKFADSMQDGDKMKREEKRKEARDVSMGWSLMALDETKKSAEKASVKLNKEIERERNYWKEVLAVKQNGWSVCRLPNERHTLGVRFGFTEASPEFRNKSLAPLRRGNDGAVILEHDPAGAGSKRVSVSLSRKGRSCGQSVINNSASEAAPLQTRVLEARNSLFSQELWHELHREAHSLASYGVRASNSHIIYEPKTGPKVTLALESLLGQNSLDEESRSEDKLAELTQLSLHLLLSYAHRQNEMQRLRPAPPHQRRYQQWHQYHLLRPLISRTLHDQSIRRCTRFIGDLIRLLHRIGLPQASFTLQNPQLPTAELATPSTLSSNRPTAAQALVNMLTAPADFQLEATFTPATRLQISGRTWFLPLTTTQYRVSLLPQDNSTDPNTNSLQKSFPPYREGGGYPDLSSLKTYLRAAIPHALVDSYLPYAEALESDDAESGDMTAEEVSWTRSIRGNAIQHAMQESRFISFELVERTDQRNKGEGGEPAGEPADLELQVSAQWRAGEEVRAKTWSYPTTTTEDQQQESSPPPIRDIIKAVVTSTDIS